MMVQDDAGRMGRRPARLRLVAARVLLASALLVGTVATVQVSSEAPAQAWANSAWVRVKGNLSTRACRVDWGWFQADNGESGWLRWEGAPGMFYFDLNRVPGWGSSTLVTIRIGTNGGGCTRSTYVVISRPSYGNDAWIGTRMI